MATPPTITHSQENTIDVATCRLSPLPTTTTRSSWLHQPSSVSEQDFIRAGCAADCRSDGRTATEFRHGQLRHLPPVCCRCRTDRRDSSATIVPIADAVLRQGGTGDAVPTPPACGIGGGVGRSARQWWFARRTAAARPPGGTAESGAVDHRFDKIVRGAPRRGVAPVRGSVCGVSVSVIRRMARRRLALHSTRAGEYRSTRAGSDGGERGTTQQQGTIEQ